jgi:hypothetical protein
LWAGLIRLNCLIGLVQSLDHRLSEVQNTYKRHQGAGSRCTAGGGGVVVGYLISPVMASMEPRCCGAFLLVGKGVDEVRLRKYSLTLLSFIIMM